MSYTNTELVRKYLSESFPAHGSYSDQLHIFSTNQDSSFYNGAIESTGFRVKSAQSNDQTQQAVVLDAAGKTLTTLPLIRGSVVIAFDSSQSVVYVENIDYIIDYEKALLLIKSGGALSVGQSVVVWYQAYFLYGSSDYTVDFQHGTIKRLLNGDIALFETVYLDYTPSENLFDDDLLSQVVIEANSQIEAEIDPQGEFGADSLLQSAATCRALEIICYVSASRSLSTVNRDEKTAQAWMKLAEQFSQRAKRLITSFRPEQSGLSAPSHG